MIGRYIYMICMCLVLSVGTVAAQTPLSLTDVKEMVRGGMTYVQDDLLVEGTVISIHRCGKLETNINDTYTSATTTADTRTAYIQSKDGVLGLALHFEHTAEADIPRYASVTVNLKGASMTLVKSVGLSASGLTKESIMTVMPGTAADLPVKEKTIAQLTDDDVYTYVRIKDCECVFKDGAYGNIYEKYAATSKLNKECKPFNTMDGWSSLLCDLNGDRINLLVNCTADWRRSGVGVEQGIFDLEGIIVSADLPRYGTENLSRYQIRPMEASAFRPDQAEEGWKTLCMWNWNDKSSRTFDPATGTATLTCEVPGASFSRCDEANNPKIISAKDHPDANGLWKDGALSISANACDWWNWQENRGNGLRMTFSAADLKAQKAYVAFAFCGGKLHEAESSADFPSYWKVEYSLDGSVWKTMEDSTATMHSMIWKANKPINGLVYPLSAEIGLGFTEHAFTFPEDISGCPTVMVRICPAARNLSTYAYKGSSSRANRPDYSVDCLVNFGSIMIRYR